MAFPKFWNSDSKQIRKSSDSLYSSLAAASLRPDLYEQGAAIDSFEGRAAMITVHATLVLGRLRRINTTRARKIAERLNTTVLDQFDAAYRETGVGDSSIARKVRKLAEVHYGLGKAFTEAVYNSGEDSTGAVVACIQRNALSEAGRERLLALYLLHNRHRLDALDDDTVLAGDFDWALPADDEPSST